MNHPVEHLSRDDLKALMREAVREELFAIGLRADEQEHIEAARRDFTFLRRCREAVEGLAAKVGWFVIMTVMGGLLFALWSGVKIKVAGP